MEKDLYTTVENNLDFEGVSPSKPAFSYYGAKQRISSQIIELFPPVHGELLILTATGV